jgi:hypothetical protein
MRRIAAACLAGLILAVAGFAIGNSGSSTKTKTITRALLGPPSANTQAVPGHPCSSKNFALNCLYNAAGQELAFLPGASLGIQFGYDFAWGGPPASLVARVGGHFGIGYLSGTSKDWSYGQLHDYLNHGLAVGFVYETYAGRALAGCSAGHSDALRANYLLSRYGIGTSAVIFFAVDTDTSAAAVASYFACAHGVLGHRTGAYGGYSVVSGLMDRGILGYCWQTLAWSYGRWDGRCKLEQVGINQSFYGYGVDPDRRLAVDAGLYPVAKPAPPPPLAKWRAARDTALTAYHHASCRKPVLDGATCSTEASRVILYQRLLDKAYRAHPRCWGAHAQKNFPVCQIVRPLLAVWGSAVRSTDRVLARHGCRKGRCSALRARKTYFQKHARAVFNEFT